MYFYEKYSLYFHTLPRRIGLCTMCAGSYLLPEGMISQFGGFKGALPTWLWHAPVVGIWKAGNYHSIHTFSDHYIFDLVSSLDTVTGGLYSCTIKKYRFLDSSILTELLWKRLRVFRSTHFAASFEIPTVAAGTEAALCFGECCPA